MPNSKLSCGPGSTKSYEIFRKLRLVSSCNAPCRLLAHQALVFRRHELTPRGETLGFWHRQQLRLIGFPLDLPDHGHRHAVATEHPADGYEAGQAHEEIAHAAGCTADIGHLGEDDREFVHHLLPDLVDIGEIRALAEHRFGEVQSLAHGGLHRLAVRLVERMDLGH